MAAKRSRLSLLRLPAYLSAGELTASCFLVLYWFRRPAEPGDEGPRLGLSVSKKLAEPSSVTASNGCCARPSWPACWAACRGVRIPGRDRAPATHRARHARGRRREGPRERGRPLELLAAPASSARLKMRRVLGALVAAADFVLIGLIRVYQYTLSPMLGQRCKHYLVLQLRHRRHPRAVRSRASASRAGACSAATPSATVGTTRAPATNRSARLAGTTMPAGM